MTFATIGLTNKNTNLVKGFDFSFDDNSNSFIIDKTPFSNVVCSLFFEKRVVEQYITKTLGFGGWAGNDGLLESQQAGSSIWYVINQGRSSTEVLAELDVLANDAVAWMLAEELVDDLEVNVEASGQGAVFSVSAIGYPTTEFSISV